VPTDLRKETDMTTAVRTATARGAASGDASRLAATVTGVLFLITFITSIPPFIFFYPPLVGDPRYIAGAGADTSVILGAFFELLLIIANIGTALALFPILKRVNESLALGFVTARVMESVFIAVGILSVLTVVTLRQAAAGTDAGALVAVGQALVALHQWTFALGPSFVVGIGNGMILGSLMYRSRLIPRPLAVLGLVAGPLLCAYMTGFMFGVFEAGSVWQFIGTLPEFVWELSLGIYLIVKGFRPAPLTAMDAVARIPALASA
jgi:hypothetical protein